MNTTELRPFLYLLLNFVVGALVAKGYIDGASRDVVINQAADIVGMLIVLATSIVTLHRVIKHPHMSTNTMTVTTKADTTTPLLFTNTPNVFTETTPPVEGGTPTPPVGDNIDTNL